MLQMLVMVITNGSGLSVAKVFILDMHFTVHSGIVTMGSSSSATVSADGMLKQIMIQMLNY